MCKEDKPHGCKSCVHFSPFYALKSWSMHRVHWGMCHRRNFFLMDKNKFPLKDNCKYWEEKVIEPIDKEKLYSQLECIQNQLCAIITALNEKPK